MVGGLAAARPTATKHHSIHIASTSSYPGAWLYIPHVLTAAWTLPLPVATPQVEGPARRSVGRRALRGLLTHNPDLFDTCLDKAYDTNTSIANGYFQVRTGSRPGPAAC